MPTKEEQQAINERLQGAIRAVISQQIETGDPKECIETLERLQEEGFSEEEAYNIIGQLVSLEVAELFAGKGEINMERYIESLHKLPAPFVEPKKTEDNEE